MISRLTAWSSLLLTAALFGCVPPTSPSGGNEALSPLLPRAIRIHPFTGVRQFDDAGGIRGIDARIEALDEFGDSIKAYGIFRFELYTYRPHEADPRGKRIAEWRIDLTKPSLNKSYWNPIFRTYQFRLVWSKSIPVGEKFVLAAALEGPGGLLSAQRVFTSGD